MIKSKEEWNISFKELKILLKNRKKDLSKIIHLSSELHDYTHEAVDSNPKQYNTLENKLWFQKESLTKTSKSKIYSAAWHLWHSARIEDITCSHFILQKKEVIDSHNYMERMNIPYRHTGNSMNLTEMVEFNNNINLDELRQYRRDVGNKTFQALNLLTIDSLQSKVLPRALSNILEIGSVAESDSWLLDYWQKKRISGIITMPLTRHLLVHLNSAIRMI